MKRCEVYFKTDCKMQYGEVCCVTSDEKCQYATEKEVCKQCNSINILDCYSCKEVKDVEYILLYDELTNVCDEIKVYYNVDKIKSYSVYIYDKIYGSNVFDILSNDIYMYSAHIIIEEAKPIIEKIQNKLREIESFVNYYDRIKIEKSEINIINKIRSNINENNIFRC